jgi:hypothetical protein
MAFATSKTTACVCAFCAAEMAGELFRNLSEKLPVEGACPRLWCRAVFGVEPLAPVFGVEPARGRKRARKKVRGVTANLDFLVGHQGLEPRTN